MYKILLNNDIIIEYDKQRIEHNNTHKLIKNKSEKGKKYEQMLNRIIGYIHPSFIRLCLIDYISSSDIQKNVLSYINLDINKNEDNIYNIINRESTNILNKLSNDYKDNNRTYQIYQTLEFQFIDNNMNNDEFWFFNHISNFFSKFNINNYKLIDSNNKRYVNIYVGCNYNIGDNKIKICITITNIPDYINIHKLFNIDIPEQKTLDYLQDIFSECTIRYEYIRITYNSKW